MQNTEHFVPLNFEVYDYKLSSVLTEEGISILKNNLEKTEEFINGELRNYLGFFYDNVEEFLENIINKSLTGEYMYYVIHKETELIGIFYFYNIREKYKRLSFGIGILPEFQCKKIGKKVVKEVVLELQNLGWVRISVEIEPDNISSLIMFCHESLSMFEYEGTLRNNYGVGIDSLIYSAIIKNK